MYSISALEQFSGIKAHTIRMWERRYNALTPARSDGNTRYYDGDQLRRLLNIVSLTDVGYKLPVLCAMTDAQLFTLMEEQITNNIESSNPSEYMVTQLIAAGINFDEAHFEKLFAYSLLRLGMKETYRQLVYPALVRMGLMWSANLMMPAYEHFVCNLIRQKLLSAIDGLPPTASFESTWLLLLPENEFHEIGLLLANYLVRQAGMKVIYLGANVPVDSATDAVAKVKPDQVLLFAKTPTVFDLIPEYVKSAREAFSGANFLLGGGQNLLTATAGVEKGFTHIQSLEDLENQIQVCLNLELSI